MLFQFLLTWAILGSCIMKIMPEPLIVTIPVALLLTWWGPAFKYGTLALGIFIVLLFIYVSIIGDSANQDKQYVFLLVSLPLIFISSAMTFLHDAVISREWKYAYAISALCWFGWFLGALWGSQLLYVLLGQPIPAQIYYAPTKEQAFIVGLCLIALPITLYYVLRALWSKKPQLTYSANFKKLFGIETF